MTDAHLDALLELAEKATPGPWATRPYDLRDWTTGKCVNTDAALGLDHPIRGVARPTGNDGYNWVTTACERNAEFIAAANPDTLRALVLALREARANLEERTAERDRWANKCLDYGQELADADVALREAREERDTAKAERDAVNAKWHGWGNERSAFLRVVQEKLHTEKSDAGTWEEALNERMNHYIAAEAEVARLGAELDALKVRVRERLERDEAYISKLRDALDEAHIQAALKATGGQP